MKVRCKFVCTSVARRKGWGDHKFLWSVLLEASEENKASWVVTPSGKLELTSILHNTFEVGTEYYLDIIPCNFEGHP